MSGLRSLERTVIRNQCYLKNGNTKGFKEAWEKYHYPRTEKTNEDGTVVVSKKLSNSRKKQRHNDNGKVIVQQLKGFKAFINSLKQKKLEEKNKINNETNNKVD